MISSWLAEWPHYLFAPAALLGLFCLVFSHAPLTAGEEALPAQPEIRRIVLYKHGIGYFERHAKVVGNAALTLHFKSEQMKDLLASFFVLDLNGGTVNAVLYDSQDPLSKRLEGILISVPESAALSQFLMQLKGAPLTVSVAGERIHGRIMGLEPVTEKDPDGRVLRQTFKLVLLTAAGVVRAVDLFAISELALQDPALQRDLERLLQVTLDAKYTDRKTVTIQAQGDGPRQLQLGYLVEQPIWKVSYRLLLEDDPQAEALLLGWALAENNTEEEWREVEIAFVAGNPLSYVMDLYTPYYPRRPEVPLPGLSGLEVAWTDSAGQAAVQRERARSIRREALPAAPAEDAALSLSREAQAFEPAGVRRLAETAAATVAAVAAGERAGELFSYQAREKISIPRGKAAMVPIVSQNVAGERVVYFRAGFSPRPVDAFILRNNTALTLEAGAVTFFAAGTSLGKGILGRVLVPGAREVLPFALDAALSVTPEIKSDTQPAYRGSVTNGQLTLVQQEILTSTWKLANAGEEEKTLVFDQPIAAGYRLTEPARPEEEVEGHYRFRVGLKAEERKEFKVVQTRDIRQIHLLANLSEEQIRFYAQQQYFSAKAKAFFAELADLQAQRTALVREASDNNTQMQRLSQEQQRLRENLMTLRDTPREADLRAKWVNALDESENRLGRLRTRLDEISQAQMKLQEQLARKVLEYDGQ